MKVQQIKPWELALILALWAGLMTGLWAEKTQADIASEVVRLHVLAKDDSPGEQSVKLAVRDEILTYLQPVLSHADSTDEAKAVLEQNLENIRRVARTAAGDRRVAVTLTEEYYPTRQYDSFSLPAGNYTSLRVILAEGQGKNWWCVVYPALCTAPSIEAAAADTLSQETFHIITGRDGYVYKFKILELWGQLKQELMANRSER